MGYDFRPKAWGTDSPKVSARLKPCSCGKQPTAGTDTVGMWSVSCSCGARFDGADDLGCDTWQELVRGWNKR